MYFLPFPVFKNLLNAKEKEKKENLGKDLVEIFAALLMLKNSEFCRRPRTKSTLLLMLLLKKYGRNFFQKAKYQGKSLKKKLILTD